MSSPEDKHELLETFGFRFQRGGAHSSRTMMLDELKSLFSHLNAEATKEEYVRAIADANCLGKRSGKTRVLTIKHLVDLYSLDPSKLIFRSLRYFWSRDTEAQPLLALLCVHARDPIFRSTAPYLLGVPEGTVVRRENIEELIDDQEPGRFSKATLKSTAQNINATWTKTGHLQGKVKKVRTRAQPNPASVAYALLLSYLKGGRGLNLFHDESIKLLDCSAEEALLLADEAARKGWIVVNRVGGIVEVAFPNLITTQEMELIREQD